MNIGTRPRRIADADAPPSTWCEDPDCLNFSADHPHAHTRPHPPYVPAVDDDGALVLGKQPWSRSSNPPTRRS